MIICFRFMKTLQKMMLSEERNMDCVWEVGSECVAYVGTEDRWFRAVVTDITADAYKVGEVVFGSSS